ncbi:hypothetical protein ACRAWD_03615 [Caulobacter segnis]
MSPACCPAIRTTARPWPGGGGRQRGRRSRFEELISEEIILCRPA